MVSRLNNSLLDLKFKLWDLNKNEIDQKIRVQDGVPYGISAAVTKVKITGDLMSEEKKHRSQSYRTAYLYILTYRNTSRTFDGHVGGQDGNSDLKRVNFRTLSTRFENVSQAIRHRIKSLSRDFIFCSRKQGLMVFIVIQYHYLWSFWYHFMV